MFFQITYDHTQYHHPDAVHSVITTIPGIVDWWHYLPNVYIVESNTLTEQEIANYILGIFSDFRFFVASINISATNGMLPKSAWDWINGKNNIQRILKILENNQNNLKSNDSINVPSTKYLPNISKLKR